MPLFCSRVDRTLDRLVIHRPHPIPRVGNRLAVALFSLAGFVIWLILVLKAYQGQMFKLP